MTSPELLLRDLAVVLMAAGAAAVLFRQLRRPIVIGYLLAGLIVGPNLTAQLVSDQSTIRLLSELGVILLMFSIGLDFRLRLIAKTASTAGTAAAVELSLMLALGYAAGHLLGWSPLASLFTGATVAISSTMIVARTFMEEGIAGRVKEMVFGTLIFEDLAAMLLIALLTAAASGAQISGATMGLLLARLAVVLALFLIFGMLVVPRVVRLVVALRHQEMLVVGAVGLCFGLAWMAHLGGFSVALGAFLAGALAAESGLGRVLEEEVRPLRDVFAAVFFVAVGMQLDPAMILESWWVILGFTVLVLVGKTVGVTLGVFLAGRGTREAIQSGLSLAQIGEFSFIIAGVGLQLEAVPPLLGTIAVSVSVVTAFLSPLLIRNATAIAAWVDRRLPHPVQTVASLYGSWVESLRSAPAGGKTPWRRVRAALPWLLLDVLAIAGLTWLGSVMREPLAGIARQLGVPARAAFLAAGVMMAAAAVPFIFGIVRVALGLGQELSAIAIPLPPQGKVDNGRAPRRTLAAALQIGIVLVTGAPLVAITQPFIPGLAGLALLLLVLLVLGVAFWRSANDLLGHLRAGAEVVVASLAKQSRATGQFEVVRQILPGLGDFEPVLISEACGSRGMSLGELNLRGHTGATVVGLLRGEERIAFPEASTRLRPGDLVALTGSHEAIEAARRILAGSETEEPPKPPRARPPRGEGWSR
jgi:CPA2 family monovalent cation:H+ antiporter-2